MTKHVIAILLLAAAVAAPAAAPAVPETPQNPLFGSWKRYLELKRRAAVKRFDAPVAVLSGATLVLLANAAVLGTTWWNRAGEPESRLELSERELVLPLWREADNTGLVLTLALADRPPAAVARTAWLRRARLSPFEHAWLDAAKLGKLGFDLRADRGGGAE